MTKLNEAVEYLHGFTTEAIEHPAIDEKWKPTIRHIHRIIDRFDRIGDLITYVQRFEPNDSPPSPIMKAIRAVGLPTMEDIYPNFMKRFGDYASDRTRLTDFIVGETYSTWQLVNFAEIYDPRGGGIFTIGPDDNRKAVFLKATLDGTGDYPNEWLEPGKVLKYYMQGRKLKGASRKAFNESHKLNQAVIQSGNTPLYVFDAHGGQNTLAGLFRYDSHKKESNGDMWFRLVKRDNFEVENPATTEEIQTDLERKIKESQTDSPENRRMRLKSAARKPRKRQAITTSFDRNPDVIAEVLDRANGHCERCKSPAPFTKKSNNKPYLEVHHKITLANGGDDTVENAIALCPNCHRELHFGIVAE